MSPGRVRTLIALALYAVLSGIFCWPLFASPHGLGIGDWDQHLFYVGSVIKNAVEYMQMPFWNPWYCGGGVLWQNPQTALLSPVYPLASFVSLALAMKITILLHYWIGFVGMHLVLTRILRLDHLPLVIYLASIFTFSGGLALHLNAGHSTFLAAFYLPTLLFLFLRCLQTGNPRDVLPGAAILALAIYSGGLQIVPIAIVVIGGIGCCAAAVRRGWRPIILAGLLGLAGFSYAAPKLLPVALFVEGEDFWDLRTGMETPNRMNVRMMRRAYVDPYQHRSLRVDPLQAHRWLEYGNYIGALAGILGLASIVWAVAHPRQPEAWLGLSLAGTTVLLLAFSAGEFSRLAPASLAAHLPFFSSFRVPSRYTIAVPLLAAVTIGWVAKSMAVDISLKGGVRMFVGVVCAMAVLQLLFENRVQLAGVFRVKPLERGFQFMAGSDALIINNTTRPYGANSPMLRALANGESIYDCYEGLQLRRTADPDRALVFGEGTARVVRTAFSPNRVDFSVVNGREPSRVVMNQNYAAGWSSSVGPVMPRPGDGKPSVMLAPGQVGRFSFDFAPPGLRLGLVVFLGATLGSVALWRRRRPGNGPSE
jgi:hypothetical protein